MEWYPWVPPSPEDIMTYKGLERPAPPWVLEPSLFNYWRIANIVEYGLPDWRSRSVWMVPAHTWS